MAAVGPFARALLRQRALAGREDASRLAERRGVASLARPDGPLIWLHAATARQFTALAPLAERLTERGFWALMTSGPAAASQISTLRLPDGAIHQFAPVDVPAYCRRFLFHWRPDLTLISEGAAPPNLLTAARALGSPVVMIDGRVCERAYGRWRRTRRTAAALIGCFDLCLAQSDEDASRLISLGARRAVAAGPLALDLDPPVADPTELAALTTATRGRCVMVAAAACHGEEMSLARAHAVARAHAPDVLTIVTPRQAGDVSAVVEAAGLQGVLAANSADGASIDRETEFFVADPSDELGLFYRIADLVFMGGSLVSEPGENPIGPAKLGTPIIHGPHVAPYSSIYDTLDRAQGATTVASGEELSAESARLLSDLPALSAMAEAAADASARLGGAIDRTIAAIEPYLMQLRLGTARP